MTDDVSRLLRPHDHLYWPDAPGPAPMVLMFHGSSGRTPAHEEDWARWFNARGYALLAVDSFTGRGVDPLAVSTGQALWGNERAVDAVATVDYAQSLDRVDPERVVAMGFSHGGWTVLDALALHPEAARLAAVIVFYPYSGPPAAHREGWTADVPVLALYAGDDTIVSTPAGLEVMQRLRETGRNIETRVLPDATHTFDHAKPNALNIAAGSVYHPEATRQARDFIATFLDRHILHSR